MKVQEKLKQFQLERKAILATNFYNYETLKGILVVVFFLQAHVIIDEELDRLYGIEAGGCIGAAGTRRLPA